MEQKLPKTQIAKQVGIARSALYEELKRGTADQMRSDLTELFEEGKVYFSHPHSSGERGTNEKQNSLVCRFIPKGKDISTVPDYAVQKAQDWINALPRRIFGYRTSEALFNEQISLLSSAA